MRCLDIARVKADALLSNMEQSPAGAGPSGQRSARRGRDKERKSLKSPIIISDWNDNAVMIAKESVHNAGSNSLLRCVDARDVQFTGTDFQLVSNLPTANGWVM